jgi:purine/pyrimidine-nucleoside phosphorylase
MSKFENVTVVKTANVYFEGRVTSRTILFADGSRKSLGIMLPGEYEFGTAEKEIMEIQSGELEVLLPCSPEWKPVNGGEAFEVPPSSRFKMRVKTISDYCCSFIA